MTKQQTFTPPQSVKTAVMRGVELQRRYDREDVTGAECLLKNGSVSYEEIEDINAFFEDHDRDADLQKREEDGGPPPAAIEWLLWGGNPARNWTEKVLNREGELQKRISVNCQVEKVDTQLGIVFGFAMICKIHGQEYYDKQDDHIVESAMLEASAKYMAGNRVAKVMHQGEPVGQVIFGFPLTEEIAKALDITTPRTGFIMGMKPESDDILDKYAKGIFTGFSIGGRRIEEEIIE